MDDLRPEPYISVHGSGETLRRSPTRSGGRCAPGSHALEMRKRSTAPRTPGSGRELGEILLWPRSVVWPPVARGRFSTPSRAARLGCRRPRRLRVLAGACVLARRPTRNATPQRHQPHEAARTTCRAQHVDPRPPAPNVKQLGAAPPGASAIAAPGLGSAPVPATGTAPLLAPVRSSREDRPRHLRGKDIT